MSDTTYNGWSNFETWALNLWLSNDEGLYCEATESVRLVCERMTERDEFGSVASLRRFEVAEGLKRWVEDMLPDPGGLAADLLGSSLARVDWYEIADDLLDDFGDES
jgi:hypothetical protein